jgi:protein TonB
MIGQGRSQTTLVVALGAVLFLLVVAFMAMVITDQKGQLKQLAAEAVAALNPPDARPTPAPPPVRRFPLAAASDADRLAPAAEPIGNPALWFSQDDYPVEARRRNETGRVKIWLKTDQQGRARSCAIVSSSSSITLDNATCDLALRRSHFTPARDAHGKATGGNWTGAIRWELSDQPR